MRRRWRDSYPLMYCEEYDMNKDYLFPFGKYQNHSIEEIFLGWSNPTKKFYEDFIKFRLLKNLLSYSNDKGKIIDVHVDDVTILAHNIIMLEPRYSLQSTGETLSTPDNETLLIDLRCKLWAGDNYSERNAFGTANDTILEMNKKMNQKYPLFSDQSYLVWCIKTIDHFFIEDLEFLESKEATRFGGIGLTMLDTYVYKYEPLLERKNLSLDDSIKICNNRKILK
jgi:hypothetical protein